MVDGKITAKGTRMDTRSSKDQDARDIGAVYGAVDALIDFAKAHLGLDPADEVWARNRVLALFELDSYRPTGVVADGMDIDELLERLRQGAVGIGLLESEGSQGDSGACGATNSEGVDGSQHAQGAERAVTKSDAQIDENIHGVESVGGVAVGVNGDEEGKKAEGTPEAEEAMEPTPEEAASSASVVASIPAIESMTPARLIDDTAANSDALDDAVMSCLTASPSVLQGHFEDVEREHGGMAAMRWFYDYCGSSTYVKRARLARNLRFDSHGLVITINLSKPEFRTMKNAAAGNSVSGGYPKCTICRENEGFAGRNKRTLRTIPVTLGGHRWFWQFSPYGYFDQHGICVNVDHTPMHVDRQTFVNLLDFVDRFPGYFLGCNAALPRIGGSVLAHDHYQGGGEAMPMHKAKAWATLRFAGKNGDGAESDAIVEILDWPGTAVRVVSHSRDVIVVLADRIREGWVHYSNPDLDIVCEGPEGYRSAVSPSVVITPRGYEMNLILRNNGVSEEFPQGIFHAHPEFWAVKQEPIGLIEAQGLFVLPGRLKTQLAHIENALVAGEPLPQAESEFSFEWDELQTKLNTHPADGRGDDHARCGGHICSRIHSHAYGRPCDREVVRAAIIDELGSICERILGNTAVFKRKEDTLAFMESLGFVR